MLDDVQKITILAIAAYDKFNLACVDNSVIYYEDCKQILDKMWQSKRHVYNDLLAACEMAFKLNSLSSFDQDQKLLLKKTLFSLRNIDITESEVDGYIKQFVELDIDIVICWKT